MTTRREELRLVPPSFFLPKREFLLRRSLPRKAVLRQTILRLPREAASLPRQTSILHTETQPLDGHLTQRSHACTCHFIDTHAPLSLHVPAR